MSAVSESPPPPPPPLHALLPLFPPLQVTSYSCASPRPWGRSYGLSCWQCFQRRAKVHAPSRRRPLPGFALHWGEGTVLAHQFTFCSEESFTDSSVPSFSPAFNGTSVRTIRSLLRCVRVRVLVVARALQASTGSDDAWWEEEGLGPWPVGAQRHGPAAGPASPAQPAAPAPVIMQLRVPSMRCLGNCGSKIKRALAAVPGVDGELFMGRRVGPPSSSLAAGRVLLQCVCVWLGGPVVL